jgi:hypothetical protein
MISRRIFLLAAMAGGGSLNATGPAACESYASPPIAIMLLPSIARGGEGRGSIGKKRCGECSATCASAGAPATSVPISGIDHGWLLSQPGS